jgi:ankyrin repeat protein
MTYTYRYIILLFIVGSIPLQSTDNEQNVEENDIHTALCNACIEGDISLVKELAHNYADINKNTETRRGVYTQKTPLYLACKNGHLDIVKELIKSGAEINPIGYITKHLHKTSRELLKMTGIVVSRIPEYLHIACEKGHLNIVKELINAGAYIDELNEYLQTPLHIVCKSGHLNIVQELINAGADANKTDTLGYIPLHHAVMEYTSIRSIEGLRNPEMNEETFLNSIKLLISHTANINQSSKYTGRTPLHEACNTGNISIHILKTIQLLIDHGADVNAHSSDAYSGKTPLYHAARRGNTRIMQLLINNDADINISDYKGNTLLYSIIKDSTNIAPPIIGTYQATKLLIDNNVDINISNDNGDTPLHVATNDTCDTSSIWCKHSLVPLLINNGADVNISNKNGITPLHAYVKRYFRKKLITTQKFISAGAHFDAINNSEETPLSIVLNDNEYNFSDDFEIPTLLYVCGADIERADKKSTKYRILKKIDSFYNQHAPNSVSYNMLATHVGENNIYIYIALLCSKGLHKHAFRIITEKAQNEGLTDQNQLRTYLVRYICEHISQFLLIAPSHMETFVHDLYMHNNADYENDTLLMPMLIKYEHYIKNELFIKKCVSLLSKHSTYEFLMSQLVNNTKNTSNKQITHQLCMSHLIKYMNYNDHDILINTFIDKYKDYINTLDSATGDQTEGTSLLEKAVQLDKKNIVRKLLQSEHINIDTMYNMFKSYQFVIQLYALASNYEEYTEQDVQKTTAPIIRTLQSITDDEFITLCADACGLNSDTTCEQFVSLLKKLTKTDDHLTGFKKHAVDIILPALEKHRYQEYSIFNICRMRNLHMYARMIYNIQRARNMASQIVRQYQPDTNTKDISRYIASYIRY